MNGEYPEAHEANDQALRLMRQIYGPTHPALAGSYMNRGIICAACHDYNSAMAAFLTAQRCVMSHARVIEPTHQTKDGFTPARLRADIEHNMGFILDKQGQLAAAADHYSVALNARRRLLGDTHPETCKTAFQLGLVWRDIGRTELALDLIRLAYEGRQATTGPNSPETAEAAAALAAIHIDRNQTRQAGVLLRPAVPILVKAWGNDHPVSKAATVLLGRVLARDRLGSAAPRAPSPSPRQTAPQRAPVPVVTRPPLVARPPVSGRIRRDSADSVTELIQKYSSGRRSSYSQPPRGSVDSQMPIAPARVVGLAPLPPRDVSVSLRSSSVSSQASDLEQPPPRAVSRGRYLRSRKALEF